ncbi:MAG: putative bifunctional diguanylate cyclase/phosphodiesterase [Geminicoccales bacterium]
MLGKTIVILNQMQRRVLLVEDDEEDYQLIQELVVSLDDLEVILLRESSYDDALKTLLDADIEACIVDNRIGGDSGVEFVRKLKAIGCNLPMIILTGADDSDVDQQALAAGASNFLSKAGLDAERLGRVLRYAMREPQCLNHGPGSRFLPPSQAMQTPSLDHHPESMRVLLIEDDEDDYFLTKELLSDLFDQHFALEWIATWELALQRVLEDSHDVVLVDYRLGARNGLELVREAVHLGCCMPFIVLTGEGNREIDLEAMHAGATDYLVKGEITAPLLDRSIRYAIERRRSEQHLAQLAQIDQLTGLANRYRFREFLDRSIAMADRQHTSVALMLIDLNRFKAVNDTYGHAAGDLLLKEIAIRLEQCVRPYDLVARLGGDEFTIVMTDVEEIATLPATAERLLAELGRPVDIGNIDVEVGASIGIAHYPKDADCGDSIIVSADTAMYAGKGQHHGSFHFYTPEMRQHANRRLELEASLRRAIRQEQFELFFQPQINLRSGRLMGFEALLRWQHPELGLVAPSDFIGIAEESGLILPIGEWALERTCKQLALWRDAGLPEVHVAVNFSARQFQNEGLLDLVRATLDRHGLPPRLLEIEITESDILQKPAQANRLMMCFSDLGIRVALDDFGTGYSSLNHLRAFPGAIIKIDRSFILDIDSASSNRAIVQSLISMAHDLDLKVVAEGVETTAQLDYLKSRNCDIVQGYLISKPLPVSAIGREIFETDLISRTRSPIQEMV